ncbi:unnamed protein product [Ixodes persulcatus]
MRKHVSWIVILLCTLVLEVRSRNLQGLWRAGPGFVPARGLRVVPGSWARERLLRERLAEDDGAGLPDDSALHPSLQVASEGLAVDRSSDAASQAAAPASPGQAEPERFPEPSSETSQDGRSSRESDDRADAGPVAGALRASDPNEHTVTRRASFMADIYFVALVAGCSAVAVFGVVAAGYCFYKVQKNARAAADVDYPAYGVTGPNKEGASPTADRKLAQSAQMYHFQHQKQQMIAVENSLKFYPHLLGVPWASCVTSAASPRVVFPRRNQANRHTSASDVDTEEEENEEGDYTVYECPGMASGGELEVKNPLFQDDRPVLPVPAEEEEEKRKRSPP